jgi:serine/threonine-protein kinase
MLSGKRAFRRDTPVESMNAVLNDEPPELHASNPNIPPALERVVCRCLEKQPERRFQSASDLAFALENVQTSSSLSGVATKHGSALGNLTWRETSAWVIAAIALTIGLYGLISRSRPTSNVTPEKAGTALRKLELYFPPPSDKHAGSALTQLVLSPDGQKLVYVNAGGLWLRSLDNVSAPTLLHPGTSPTPKAPTTRIDGRPFWSPGSTEVGYFEGDNVYTIRVADGTTKLICRSPTGLSDLAAGTWLTPERLFLTPGFGGLYEVSAKGGEPKSLQLPQKGESWFGWVSALPEEKGVLFSIITESDLDTIALWTPPNGRKIVLRLQGKAVWNPVYSKGYILFERRDTESGIWAFSFSLKTLERTGEPFRVSSGASLVSASNDGTLLANLTAPALRQLVWVDRAGQITGNVGAPQRGLEFPALSPDQSTVAVNVETTPSSIWLISTERDSCLPLVSTTVANNVAPLWFADGRKILFRRWTRGKGRIVVKDLEGPEEEWFVGFNGELSRSGKYFLGWNVEDSGTWYVALSDTNRTRVPFPADFQQGISHTLSPDDTMLAYVSNQTGENEVYVAAFPSFTRRTQLARGCGSVVVWHPNGSEVFYSSRNGRTLFSVTIQRQDGWRGETKKLFDLPESILSPSYRAGFAVSRDGQRFLMIQAVPEPLDPRGVPKPSALLVENWMEEFGEKK